MLSCYSLHKIILF